MGARPLVNRGLPRRSADGLRKSINAFLRRESCGLERDAKKWVPVFEPITIHEFESTRPKIIVILERIPQKLTDFCDENSLHFLILRDFLSLERFRSSGKRARARPEQDFCPVAARKLTGMFHVKHFCPIESENRTSRETPSALLRVGWRKKDVLSRLSLWPAGLDGQTPCQHKNCIRWNCSSVSDINYILLD